MQMAKTASSANAWVMLGGNEKDLAKTRSWLSHLPPELMMMVASHLDISSYLALASTSTNLSEALVSQLQWDELLTRTRLDLNLWMALMRRDDLFGPNFGQASKSGQGINWRYMKMVWIHGGELDEEADDEEEDDNQRAFVMLPWEQVDEWALPPTLPWEGEQVSEREEEQVVEWGWEQGSEDWEEEEPRIFRLWRSQMDQEREEEWKLDEVRTTEMSEMHKELNQLVGLLKLVNDPERNLLRSLLHTICQRFPIMNGLCPRRGRQYKKIEVFLSCLHCQAVHGVTLFGFLLLQKIETDIRGSNVVPLLKLKVINAGNSGDIDNGGDIEKHLENFTAYALHQSQPVESFVQTNWSNSSEKRLKLLEHCATWKLESLDFEDDDKTTELWEKLWKGWGGLAAKGTIVELNTSAKILKHVSYCI